MILGIGVDTVEIVRFALWHSYSKKKLSRIFSAEEIEYCLEVHSKSAERFAVRFAAREALYKAFSYAYPEQQLPFLTLCRYVKIIKINNRPHVFFAGDIDCIIHLSFSHSRTHATAFVIIEKKSI